MATEVGEDSPRPSNEAADIAGRTDEALVLMKRAVASRDPLELGLAELLSDDEGRTFDKHRRVVVSVVRP